MSLFSMFDLEPHKETPSLKESEMTGKDIIVRLALLTIRNHREIFQKIPFLENSPILDAALYFQQNEDPIKILGTVMSASPLSQENESNLFSRVWKHFLEISNVEPSKKTNLIKFSLKAINKAFNNSNIKSSKLFEHIFTKDREKVVNQKIEEKDTIVGQKGVFSNEVNLRHATDEENIINLQYSLGVAALHFARNQKSRVAGHIDNQFTDSKIYKDSISFLEPVESKDKAGSYNLDWSTYIKSPKLLNLLEKNGSTIPQTSEVETHDQSVYFASKDAFTPSLNHPDFARLEIKAIKVRIFHQDGIHYNDQPMIDAMTMDPKVLQRLFTDSVGEESPYWKKVDDLKKQKEADQYIPLSISYNRANVLPTETYLENKTIHSISLTTAETVDKINFSSGHMRVDGAAQIEMIDMVTAGLETEIIVPTKDFYRVAKINLENAERELTGATKAEEIIKILGLKDVVIGHIMDLDQLSAAVNAFNEAQIKPRNKAIVDAIESTAIMGEISSLIHLHSTQLEKFGYTQDKDLNEIVTKQICAILNPNSATVDTLAMAGEISSPGKEPASSAICTLPISNLRRLSLYLANKIKPELHSIKESFILTSTDRVLTKLGIGPLGFSAMYASKVQDVATMAADYITPDLGAKVKIVRQFSDLGKHRSSWFVSALSAFNPELAQAIGISGKYMTARTDFSKREYLDLLQVGKSLNDEEFEKVKNFIYPSEVGFPSGTTSLEQFNNLIKRKGQEFPSFEDFIHFALKNRIHPETIQKYLIGKAYLDLTRIPEYAIRITNRAKTNQEHHPSPGTPPA